RSQWPLERISRAITGNLASSLVASTRRPRSKPKSAALPAITIANGTHAPPNRERRSGPAFMGQVVVAPRIQHHQGPQDLAVVPTTCDVLRCQSRHHGWIDQAAPTRCREVVHHDLTEGTTQPACDGNPEPLLTSPDHARRQDLRQGALQDVFGPP